MTKPISALLGATVVIFFFCLTLMSADNSPALRTAEYIHDPATALLDRQQAREHDERMAEIELQGYNDRMFWRAATALIVLCVLGAVLAVVLAATARRNHVRRDVYVLPAERRRIAG